MHRHRYGSVGIKSQGSVQGRVRAAQGVGEVALQVVGTADDVVGFLGTEAGEYQVAGGRVAARPVRGAEGAVTLESLNNLENILSVRVHKSFIVARFR